MLRRARIAGHPIHPMLVGFPIALFTATLALELAHIGTRDAFFYRAAMIANISGVVMALLAAIPGAIDLKALHPSSRARAVGGKHAMLNLVTVGLFAVSGAILLYGWLDRVMVDGAYLLSAHVPLALGMLGMVTMVSAMMLGYSLVQTHHVGVEPGFVRSAAREPAFVPYRAPVTARHAVIH